MLSYRKRDLSKSFKSYYSSLVNCLWIGKPKCLNSYIYLRKRSNKLILQLPPRQQEALRLRFIEEMEYSEVATIMSINRQSAQNLVARAVEKLRKSLPLLVLSLFQFIF